MVQAVPRVPEESGPFRGRNHAQVSRPYTSPSQPRPEVEGQQTEQAEANLYAAGAGGHLQEGCDEVLCRGE